ncbi:dihydroorotase [Pediococcus stilesii]|uniref:Dihydroorotase n=1 Tax=Pediococcus stilesii TaxID=331679 RepID=A0A0R2L4X7_9LACO|nr:dihydroorotase [Pediococcus stilesii]KRN93949.1 dihydroorotase [Pediococcus stilesii]
MRILLKNANAVLKEGTQLVDILIENTKIVKIDTNIETNAERVIDIEGQLVLPGLIDVHVHFRDPGQTQKEDVVTGSHAAARGGYTTVWTMPNVDPVPDTAEKMKKMVEHNRSKSIVHIEQYGSITKKRTSEELVDFKALKDAGAIAFSNDGNGIQTAEVMYEAMKQIKALDLPLAAHVEDESLMQHGVMNEGDTAKQLGLPGISELTETAQLARDLEIARNTGVHYHVCHVSKARSVELIRRAQRDGVNVTAEVAPHHLFLDETMITMDNPMMKMNPPLRTLKDRQALLSGLLDGTIGMIATDHAPHTVEDKTGSMKTAAFGITGLETAFSLLYTKLVKSGICTIEQLVQWMSSQPAQIFNIQHAGELKSGEIADLTVMNVDTQYKIEKKDFASKGVNTPFVGQQVYGRTELTMVAGKIVFQRKGQN